MPMFDDRHVKIVGCFVVWDGITRPDTGPDGKAKYSLKVVVDPNHPDLALFSQLANTSLQQSKFGGILPAGGRMPIGQAQANEFNGLYTGYAVLNCNSQRLPDVYDENGQRLDPMQYGAMIYGGQQVDILIHCYEYDKMGNKGIATGLDGFAIIASANAPRQQFGGSGVDTAGAFGGGQQPAPGMQAPGQTMPQQPMAGQSGQPMQGGGMPQQPMAGQPGQPMPQQPMAGQPGQPMQGAGYAQPVGAGDIQNGQQPQQAHNFLPQQ